MKLSALLQDVETLAVYKQDCEILNVTDDTNKVGHGSVFVCIKGKNTDGNELIETAVSKGASVIVSEHTANFENCVVVADSRKAYALMCANFYGNCHRKLHMIGVTGTNGKTTVACLIKSILEKAGHKVGLLGTVKVIIGDEQYPASLTTPAPSDFHRYLMMMNAAGCDFCVAEISSQALAQDRVYGVEFDCGVFTNLSPEHLDYHETMVNYLEAKLKLFRHSKFSVINADDKHSSQVIKNVADSFVTVSLTDKADYTAKDIHINLDGVSYNLVCRDKEYPVKFPTTGKFSVYNSMQAIASACYFGVDINEAIKAIGDFEGIPGRTERIPNSFGINVIIDFAHTPDSLENMLITLKSVTDGKLITVFGCGGDRDKSKRHVMGKIACKYSDTVFITSDNPRTEKPEDIIRDICSELDGETYFKITDRTQAIKAALFSAKSGDTVLIAGKGHEKYQILGKQKIYYNEREIIKRLLEEKARF